MKLSVVSVRMRIRQMVFDNLEQLARISREQKWSDA